MRRKIETSAPAPPIIEQLTLLTGGRGEQVSITGSQQFHAALLDQFGEPVFPTPTFDWSVSGGGEISPEGLFSSSGVPGGPHVVLATFDAIGAQASVSISSALPAIVAGPTATPMVVTGTSTELSILGMVEGGEQNLSYGWFASGPHGVQVTPNGDNAAKNATATFIAAGTYPIDVVVHDLYGQTAQSSVTVTVLPVARSLQLFPEIISVASSSSWSFLLKGIDQFFQPLQPSGVAWSVSGGGTIDSNGVLTTDSQTGGPYTVTATVNQVSASSTFYVANQPPDLLQAPLAAQKPVVGTSTTLSVLGTGVGGEAALTYDWYSFDGPAPVVFSPDQSNAAKNTTATFSASGVYQIGVRLLDPLGQQTSGYLELPVQPIVQAVSILPSPASGEVGQPINLAASVTDQFAHQVTRDVAFSWSTLSGPASASFAAPGAPSTSALFAVAGSYVLRTTATGGGQTRSADVAVQVTPPNLPPVIAMGLGASLQLPDRTATLSATVTDDGLPLQGSLSRFWSVVSGPAAVAFSAPESDSTTATFIEPGAYVLKLTAHDGKLTSSKTVSVNVQAIDAAKPVVALTGPSDGEEITAPTAITGSVSQGSWRLEYRLGGEGEGGWTPFASGTGPTSGTLATFDPTLLLNGVYAVRLVATTSGGSTQADFAASVTRNMKVGHFTLAFTDLQIPVSGLPITLVRSYDSRDKRVGDFGVGWQLAIKNARVEESRPVGRAWKQTATDTFFPTYTIDSAKSHDLTITFGGNKVYRFRAAPTPGTSFLLPIPDGEMHYEAVAPTVGSVQPLDYAAYMVRPGQPGELISLDTLEELKLERFLLTTEDGTQWTVSKSKGVEQMVDRVGNTLVINDQGITHSSGKSVTFVRDADGRITTITDPNGNAMHYHYDLRGDLVDFTDRDQAKQAFTYQSDHLLLDYTDANGHRAVRNDYDADGRLLSQTDANGKSVTFTHSLAQRQEVVHDRLGHPTLFEYDTRGNVTRTVDAHGEVKTMTYDVRDNKLTETDELGHTTTFAYDANDNEISRTDPLGHTWSKTWNAYRQVVTETDPLGHTTSNALNFTNGLLDSTTDALGHTTHFLYNVFTGDRVRTTDALGHATNYSYDNAGRVLTETDALGHQTSFTYDANGNKLTETTTRTHLGQPQVLVTSHVYDKHDRLVKTTHPDGSSTRTEYGPTGQVARRIDELGHVTAMAYDDLERLVLTTYPDGTTTSQTYDDEGRTVTRTDQAGRVTTMAYDELGRLLTTTHADLTSSGSTYDAAGRVQAQTNENGHTTTFVYDDANRRTQTINALGHATTTTYDAAGRTVAVTDPLLHSTTSAYDDAGRLTLVTFADGTSQAKAYDDVGRLTAMTDELGRVTSRAYDDLGRLTSVTDALNHTTSYGYDELGRLTSQTDANNHSTSFAFDSRGRQIARTLPDGATETKTFDGVGNALTRTDFAGRTTVYSYDAMNRLLSRLYPDGSSVSFAYTPTGRRASFTDDRGTTGYTYDVRDRVTSLTYPDGRSLAYGYDALGHRASLTANVGGHSLTTTYGYDLAERPATVTDPLQRDFSLAYDDAGRLTTMAYPNGTTTSYGYDARNRSTTIATMGPGNALVQSYALTLDNAGRRTAIAEGDGTQKAYGYDAVDRLVSETVSGGSGPQYGKTFTYDAVGNRLQQETVGDGAASVSYSYDSRDRLVSEGATVYASDANGNVVSKTGEATYAWDFEQRLSSVTLANGTVVAHAYDPAGNRVRTTVTPLSASSVSTEQLVDVTGGLSQVVAESSGGALGAVYVRVGDVLVGVVRPAGGGWEGRGIHGDYIGSVRALTDESGLVSAVRGYEAFGARNNESGGDALAYGFAGEPTEGTSGLNYHRARWTDARVGRFLEMDPLAAFADGGHSAAILGENFKFLPSVVVSKMSLKQMIDRLSSRLWSNMPPRGSSFVYSSNNPANRVDPSGEEDISSLSAGIVGTAILSNLAVATVRGSIAGEQWFGLATHDKGPADAMRHCVAGCAATGPLTGLLGAGIVQTASGIHEFLEVKWNNAASEYSSYMDLYNTQVGIGISYVFAPVPCEISCKKALDEGELIVQLPSAPKK